MRIGTFLPHVGATATPEFLIRSAKHAEALDYDSVWVAERLLYPLTPRTPYPGMPEGSQFPDMFRQVLEPIDTLAFVAAHTSKIRLGTGVLIMPFHNPALLARRLATLDVLSGGRLNVGLGQGWSIDEMEAAGASLANRAERADEFVAVLRAMWGPDPVEHHGKHFQVAASIIQPKPVQQSGPPIYMAAYVPRALARVARISDGWIPSGIPLAGVSAMMAQVRQQAEAAGRDPAALALLSFGFVNLTDRPLGEGRQEFAGSLDEIRRDVETAREIGVDTLIVIPQGPSSQTEDGFLRVQEQLRALV